LEHVWFFLDSYVFICSSYEMHSFLSSHICYYRPSSSLCRIPLTFLYNAHLMSMHCFSFCLFCYQLSPTFWVGEAIKIKQSVVTGRDTGLWLILYVLVFWSCLWALGSYLCTAGLSPLTRVQPGVPLPLHSVVQLTLPTQVNPCNESESKSLPVSWIYIDSQGSW
jgi:hypothetical protein